MRFSGAVAVEHDPWKVFSVTAAGALPIPLLVEEAADG